MIKNWKALDTKKLFESQFCDLRVESCELPDGRVMPSYYILDFSNWVNIVPITKEGKILLIKQYRHATGEICIEIPGGAIHRNEKGGAQSGALRELEEETGFSSSELISLGEQSPNPATQSNTLYTYVALDCFKIDGQNLDPFEEIEVLEVLIGDMWKMVERGEIKHSLVLSSLLMAKKYLN